MACRHQRAVSPTPRAPIAFKTTLRRAPRSESPRLTRPREGSLPQSCGAKMLGSASLRRGLGAKRLGSGLSAAQHCNATALSGPLSPKCPLGLRRRQREDASLSLSLLVVFVMMRRMTRERSSTRMLEKSGGRRHGCGSMWGPSLGDVWSYRVGMKCMAL
jgi:hypothetical protein